MKKFVLLGLLLAGCNGGDAAYCIDLVEDGDANEDGDHVAYTEGEFDGIEICVDNGAVKDCEKKGGEALNKDEYENGPDEACGDNGFNFRCGASIYVKAADDCPESYVLTEVE